MSNANQFTFGVYGFAFQTESGVVVPTNDLGVYSHFPVLAAALAKTTGPVLELGMGWGSTPMLHAMCRAKNRLLMSYESDKEWMKRFHWMENSGHELISISRDEWTKHGWVFPRWVFPSVQNFIGVAFIDCAPGEIRKDLAMKLKGSAKFILLHDALSDPPHGAGRYGYEQIIPKFKYHEFYRVVRPATLILSDVEPFGLSEEEQRERTVL